jgi:ornithine cyclodeaminase
MTNAHGVRVVTAAEVAGSLGYDQLVAALRTAFVAGAETPMRHHHTVRPRGEPEATLLLMPAWQSDRLLGVKIVSVFPGNRVRGQPALSSSYLLCDATTGAHLALIDGNEITGRRTAATAALGASYLARPDASRLLLVGAGRIAGEVPFAMRAVRPIRDVAVWNTTPDRATTLVGRLNAAGFRATIAADLEEAVRDADIVSCATLATTPLIAGAWLQAGVHLDLIGSFTPTMREADDDAMRRAQVFIDDRAGLAESGDLLQPLQSGALGSADACVTLASLCRGEHPGRTDPTEITLFKAVGTALADLAAAALVYRDLAEADRSDAAR